jgi:hypothetical protein
MIAQSIMLPTGTTVTYEPPTATDYFLKSVACTPDSENLFALGTTEVTCTTKDTSDNTATKTFKVAIKESIGQHMTRIQGIQSTLTLMSED